MDFVETNSFCAGGEADYHWFMPNSPISRPETELFCGRPACIETLRMVLDTGGPHGHVALRRAGLALFAALIFVRADQVEMLNGDRYNGKILSLDTNTLVFQNDVLGTVRLPRAKTATITVGQDAPQTNAIRTLDPAKVPPAAPTNAVIDLSASLKQLGANTNFIQQVQSQILGTAGPEANKKFNELVGGMMSGRITVNDLRAEARSAVTQLKELKSAVGDNGGEDLDGYLAILEGFLRETAPAPASSATNAPAPAPKPKPAPLSKE